MANLIDELKNAIVELEADKVVSSVKAGLDEGLNPLSLVKSLQAGMVEIGDRFAKGEYYLSELIMSGEIMKNAMALIEPKLAGLDQEHRGSIVIGTVQGDIHDLGKNIVVMLLKGAGYNVVDLGVDVPAEKFIEATKEHKAPLVAMSVLLTGCQDPMKDTIKAIRDAGLNDVKVLIGGNYVDEKVKEYCGADYFGTSADEGVKVANQIFA
ncbi:MAG TPA: 5-methyltetrahydrofolate--homocysteine methyltransferase [Syntrophaceticus sp.]|jgi:5-methyltetrahydrofolate--homocysteine methyltransferase|nr:cobalamin-dependent protein [Syntrophaceticus schinkii]MDD4261677.1 cobalamin-dependent protein [Syntrophaceticus schinkii]MDD4675472.1 cobalamin-dependent protein [Syntrophaceticus schinkii]HHY31138.1 5-methyltetrahydrofolate--homocysteine methyltransferase [Syntrophaceticus sp.]